jgi:hypothetical protein
MRKLIVGGIAAFVIAGPLMGAGTANASCASLNGHDIGKGCVSGPGSLSIGLGKDAQVHTDGYGNLGVAIGNPGQNPVYGFQPTQAYAGDRPGNVAIAIGDGSNAGSLGLGNVAIAVGPGNNAYSFGGHPVELNQPSKFNTSIVVGKNSNAYAIGSGHKLATTFGNGKQ